MPTTRKHPRLILLHPASVLLLLVVMAAWAVAWVLPEPTGQPVRVAARVCGYLGAFAMLVPYLHIARRFFRHRHIGQSRAWLAWHVGAAYAAFFFVLVHSRGRTNGPLTLALLVLLWVVMVSGAAGYYGQKLLYALMPRMVRREYGLERIEHQRLRLLALARVQVADQYLTDWKTFAAELQKTLEQAADGAEREELSASLKMLKRGEFEDTKKGVDHRAVVAAALLRLLDAKEFQPAGDAEYGPELKGLLVEAQKGEVGAEQRRERNRLLLEAHFPQAVAPTTGAVRLWCDEALRDGFEQPFSFWRWLVGRPRRDGLSRSSHDHALAYAGPGKGEGLRQLWSLVEERRELDLEYRLHHLGRLWLLFHGPAAWALLVLMVEHIVSSVLYGGW